MKKIILPFFALIAMVPCLISCASGRTGENLYSPVNYTQEDAVKDEIKTINSILEKESVKALWRACLLLENSSEMSGVKECYDECLSRVQKDLNKAWEEKKYTDALRLSMSLENAGVEQKKAVSPTSLQVKAALEKEVASKMPSSSGGQTKVSQMINGTVTVFVDKGIKVENGAGRVDSMLGSGFFISSNGYIITNHHVIADCVDPSYKGYAKLYIKLAEDSDTRIPAKVIGYDKIMDLALLKTEVDAPYVFSLGSSKDLDVGDSVYAIGSPLGLERTLTSGIISATDRELLSMGKVFQIDAAVNSGNSGGPMIDSSGKVQAVVFAGVVNYQGLNFAIPVEYLKSELPFLLNGGNREHCWMGAYGRTKRLAGSGAKNEGLEILYVMPGGSASRAGLKAGDVIVAINDTKITSIDDMHLSCLQMLGSSICTVQAVNAEGKTKKYTVYMDKRSQNPGYDVYTHDLISEALYPLIGMELVKVSTTNKNKYSVTKVIKASIADESGFSDGDPVEIIKTELSPQKDYLLLQIYAQRKNNGYLDFGLGLQVPLESFYYF
ncbi:MAG: serine protease [Treponema sp.]|nr:serine protease [Treponema sp.]